MKLRKSSLQKKLMKMFLAYHFRVLGEFQVVFTESHCEDDGRYAFETVYPLLSLRPLTANIEHPANNPNIQLNPA